MKNKKIRNYQIFSTIIAFALGTLLHFTYKLSGENSIVAVFSAINESTWEHLKLLFFPMLLTTIFGYFYIGKEYSNFVCSNAIGIILAMSFTVTFFYTYTGIIGKNIAFIDIISFFVAILLGEYIVYKLIISNFKCNNSISKVILLLLLCAFVLFTYHAPNLGIFKDPLTKTYGVIS